MSSTCFSGWSRLAVMFFGSRCYACNASAVGLCRQECRPPHESLHNDLPSLSSAYPWPKEHGVKLAVRILLLGIGIGVFTWFIANADHEEIWHALGSLGWMAPLVLLPYGLVYHVETLAWSLAFAVRP